MHYLVLVTQILNAGSLLDFLLSESVALSLYSQMQGNKSCFALSFLGLILIKMR